MVRSVRNVVISGGRIHDSVDCVASSTAKQMVVKTAPKQNVKKAGIASE